MVWSRAYCEPFICSKPCWTEVSPNMVLIFAGFYIQISGGEKDSVLQSCVCDSEHQMVSDQGGI